MSIPTIPRWKSAIRSMRMAKNPLPFLDQVVEQHGATTQIYLGGLYRMIITTDADFIQHILQKNHRKYKKSDVHFDRISHFLGKGLLTSEGEYWLRQRRLIQPGFHRGRLSAILQLMDQVCEEHFRAWDQKLQSGSPTNMDFNQKMMELAFSIIAHSIFSEDLEKEELEDLSEGLTVLQKFIIQQIRQPYMVPIHKWNGQITKHEAIRDKGNQLVLKYINARRASGQVRDDLLQMLLDIRYEDTGEGMTDQQLIDEANILFVAGHETSANALAWAWYLIAQHPEVREKMLLEIKQVIGDSPIEMSHIMALEYIEQVLNETMRLYPPAWTTNRIATDDDTFKDISIQKGTVFSTYIYGLHRSKEYWTSPNEFKPERFAKENSKDRHPAAFIPFGAGPRLCIGNQFAMMEMKLILVKMLQRYQVELVEGQNIFPQPLITLRPAESIMMKLSRRR